MLQQQAAHNAHDHSVTLACTLRSRRSSAGGRACVVHQGRCVPCLQIICKGTQLERLVIQLIP